MFLSGVAVFEGALFFDIARGEVVLRRVYRRTRDCQPHLASAKQLT
jgi:hypothetical protein